MLTSIANLVDQFSFEVYVDKNRISNINAESPLSILTVFFNSSDINPNSYKDKYISYNKQNIKFTYAFAPTEIDFHIYCHFENVKFYM